MSEASSSSLEVSADDEYVDIALQSPRDAAGRLLVLVSVARRGYLEQETASLAAGARAAEQFDVAAWLTDERLNDFATPSEATLLTTPAGALDAEAALEATWALEGAAALAWAIGLLPDAPPLTLPADATPLLEALPPTWARTTEFRDAANLRVETEIATEREIAEIWAARAQLWYETADGDPDAAATCMELASEAAQAGLVVTTGGDFAVNGSSYAELTAPEIHDLAMIAEHRLSALNWLCGLAELG